MPAEKVKGTDAMIKFNIQGTMAAYCYAKSFELSTNVELIGVSTIGDGATKKFRPKRYSFTISMDAVFLITDDPPNNASVFFIEQHLQFIETPFEIFYTGELGGVASMSGRCFIQGMTFSHTPSGFVSKNVTMQGNGRINRGVTPTSVVDLTMSVVAVEGGGTQTMSNIILTDMDGNEITVYTPNISAGGSQVVSVPAGVYHVRAKLNSTKTYNLYESDAAPGFAVNLGAVTNLIYWPYPPNSPVWDFTSNRFLRWTGSDSPIA